MVARHGHARSQHALRPPFLRIDAGEPTPCDWPSISSHFGIIDIAGFAKDSSAYYAAWWKGDSGAIGTIPSSWNAPVAIGSSLSVVVFAAAASARLWVNGVAQNAGAAAPIAAFGFASFPGVVYTPGNLTACSYADAAGTALLATRTVLTSGPAAALRLSADAASA